MLQHSSVQWDRIEVEMIEEQTQAIALARARGETLASVGREYGVSHQRVSQIMTSVTHLVNEMDLGLMLARKVGRPYIRVIPHQDNYTGALAFSDYLVQRLRDRGMDLRISTRRCANGLALELEDVTPSRRDRS
jgi:hypothetical protein